jgi:hypothetical protein
MNAGVLICYPCELAGRPAGSRFTVVADDAGRARMVRHVLEPHLAQDLVTVPDSRSIDLDLDLDGEEAGS